MEDDDDHDDDEGHEHKAGAKARQRGLDATAQCLALCTDWACCIVSARIWLLRIADQSLTSLDVSTASCACFDANGTRLLVGGDDKQVTLYEELPAAKAVRQWTANKKIGRVAFSPDGQTAMWADLFGEVHGVALADADAAPALVLGHLSPVSHLVFTNCGKALLTSDREGHVRSSQWPHAFVIDCYYLWHTKPLLVLLPLVSNPLLLTAAADGLEICAWRVHSGALLSRFPAAELLGSGGGSGASGGTGGTGPVAIACACEVAPQGLVALGFTGRHSISFCSPTCDWIASTAKLSPRPELECTLSAEPLAMAYSAASSQLCLLLRGGTGLVLVPATAAGDGFNAKALTLVGLVAEPDAVLPPAAAEDSQAAAASPKRAKLS